MSTDIEISRAAAVATFLSVLAAIIGGMGEIIFGGMIFGAIAGFGLTILAALVLSHERAHFG
jgi:hypothetical protein